MSSAKLKSVICADTGFTFIGSATGVVASASIVSNTANGTSSITAPFTKSLASSTFVIDIITEAIPSSEIDATFSIQFDGQQVGNTVPFHGTSGISRYNVTLPFVVSSNTLTPGQHNITLNVTTQSGATMSLYQMQARMIEYGS